MNRGDVTMMPTMSITLLNSATAAFVSTNCHCAPSGIFQRPGLLHVKFGPPQMSNGGQRNKKFAHPIKPSTNSAPMYVGSVPPLALLPQAVIWHLYTTW